MKVYGIPLILFVTSLIGLITMLMLESAVGDNLALLLLCLPLAALVRYGFIKRPASR